MPTADHVNMVGLRLMMDAHIRTKKGHPAQSTTGVANTNSAQDCKVWGRDGMRPGLHEAPRISDELLPAAIATEVVGPSRVLRTSTLRVIGIDRRPALRILDQHRPPLSAAASGRPPDGGAGGRVQKLLETMVAAEIVRPSVAIGVESRGGDLRPSRRCGLWPWISMPARDGRSPLGHLHDEDD